MNSFSASAVVCGGKLALEDRHGWHAAIRQFGEGECVVVTVEPQQAHHTRAQECFFHGPVLDAFRDLGYRKQEAKDLLALLFLPQDIKLLDGSTVRVPGHTSALNKQEYSEFIDACIQLAAEQGLVIQDVAEYQRTVRHE